MRAQPLDHLLDDIAQNAQPADAGALAASIRQRAKAATRANRIRRGSVIVAIAVLATGGVAVITNLGDDRNQSASSPVDTRSENTAGPESSEATPPPSSANTVAPADGVTIRVGVFSGRPDPSWEATDAEIDQLVTLIASLSPTSESPPLTLQGFSGFTVDGLSVPSMEWAHYFEVKGGLVRAASTGTREAVFEDPQGVLDRFLLEAAERHLSDDIYEIIVESRGDGSPPTEP